MHAQPHNPYLSLRWGVFWCEVGWVFCVGCVCGRGAGQQKSVELLGLGDRNLQEQTLHHQFLHLRTETWITDTVSFYNISSHPAALTVCTVNFRKYENALWVCMCDTDPGEGYNAALCKTPTVLAQKHPSPDTEMEIHTVATIKQWLFIDG